MIAQAGILIVVGTSIGLFFTVLVQRQLRGVVFGVAPLDPATLGGSALVLTAAALSAALVPSTRAAKTDPVGAIRSGAT